MTDDDVLRLEHFFVEVGRGARVYGGIDPGVSGALAFISGPHSYVTDIPVAKVPTTKKTAKGNTQLRSVFDASAICRLFGVVEAESPERVVMALEKGAPRPIDTPLTGFTVGCGYGLWPLFLHRVGVSCVEVPPAVWKKKLGLAGKGNDKEEAKELSRMEAQRRWPKAPLSAKAHHNRAEALLLALWAKETQQ